MRYEGVDPSLRKFLPLYGRNHFQSGNWDGFRPRSSMAEEQSRTPNDRIVVALHYPPLLPSMSGNGIHREMLEDLSM